MLSILWGLLFISAFYLSFGILQSKIPDPITQTHWSIVGIYRIKISPAQCFLGHSLENVCLTQTGPGGKMM